MICSWSAKIQFFNESKNYFIIDPIPDPNIITMCDLSLKPGEPKTSPLI